MPRSTKSKRGGRAAKADQLLAALCALRDKPDTDRARAQLDEALASSSSPVVLKAAGLIAEHRLAGFNEGLLDAFARFSTDPIRRDPGLSREGCRTPMRSTIWSMTTRRCSSAQPRSCKLEPVWGGRADTAGPLRSRAALALARLGHADTLLVCGQLLADAEAGVRITGGRGDCVPRRSTGSGPAACCDSRWGDEEPMVIHPMHARPYRPRTRLGPAAARTRAEGQR